METRVDTGELAELRVLEAFTRKTLYLVDATYSERCDDAVLADVDRLTAVASAAVATGGGHVLQTSHVVFPNGAITLVLILAESHLSVHTWPEERLVAIDLFSCGAIDGASVISQLAADLGLGQPPVREIPRG